MVQIRTSVDQDINFRVNDISCRMSLDTSGEGSKGDLWFIYPSDPQNPGEHFIGKLNKVLESLTGWPYEQGHWAPPPKGEEPRHTYSWEISDEGDYIRLHVGVSGLEDRLIFLIRLAPPEWDGQTLNFPGSYRIADLFADWKDAIPEIQFTRSDGTPIEYEQHVDQGPPHVYQHKSH